jgi:hypothetical protein
MNKPQSGFVGPGVFNLRPNKLGQATSPQIMNKPVTSTTRISDFGGQTKPQITASRSKVRGQKRAGRANYIPRDLVTPINTNFEDSSTSSSGDSFSQRVDRSPFFDDHSGSPVTFNMPLDVVYATQQLDKPEQGSGYINNRLSFNMSRYSDVNAFSTVVSTEVVEQFKVIYNMQTRDVKQKVRSGTLLNKWTFTKWYKAIMTVCEALEVFYTLDSILSYSGSSEIRDKNKALSLYRELFETSSIFYAKDILRRNLKGAWFPVSWSRLIQWTYQNYRVADLPQAEAIRFLPNEAFVNAYSEDLAVPVETLLNTINARLIDDDTTSIFSMLAQCYPEGEINGLPYSSNTTHFDKYILEMFSNQPNIYSSDSNTQETFPNAAQITAGLGYMYYGSMFDPQVDTKVGLPFALQTIYDNDNDVFIDFFKAFRVNKYGTEGSAQYYNINKYNSIVVAGVLTLESRFRENSVRFNTCPDVHFLKQDIAGGVVKYEHSNVRAPMQPVYFDIKQSPLIILREFMTSLFGL